MEKALIIRERWLDLILRGKKTWEMRSRATNVRGPIGLIRAGSGMVVATANLVDSKPALTRDSYMAHGDKHGIPVSMLEEVLVNGWVYPWLLSDVRRLPQPVPYSHKSGAVTFVKLEPSVIEAIELQRADMMSAQASEAVERTIPRSIPSSHRASPPPSVTGAASSISRRNDEALFVFRSEKAEAYGQPLADGEFVVLVNSTAMRSGSPNVKRNAYERDKLVRDGVLVPDLNPDLYRFARDHVFSSSSAAAGIIKDGNASGPSLWKDDTGKTLKEHLAST